MTDKPIHELHIGDFVADMHYGVEQLEERFDVVSHVRWEEPTRRDGKPGYVDHPFFDYLGEFTNGMIGNKHLIVIDWADDSTLTKPKVICAYCYDGRRSGVIVLQEKRKV